MSKKYYTSQTLLIVESPAKCKKIEEFLGSSYKCIASYGHLRKLTSLEDIDMNSFEANYKTTVQVDKIKKEIS
jgi:DNA topoisomerase-1